MKLVPQVSLKIYTHIKKFLYFYFSHNIFINCINIQFRHNFYFELVQISRLLCENQIKI